MNALAHAAFAPRSYVDHEVITIALTKALTDWLQARGGHGVFIAEQETGFIRREIYNAAGLNGWTLEHDAQAARRMRIWARLFLGEAV